MLKLRLFAAVLASLAAIPAAADAAVVRAGYTGGRVAIHRPAGVQIVQMTWQGERLAGSERERRLAVLWIEERRRGASKRRVWTTYLAWCQGGRCRRPVRLGTRRVSNADLEPSTSQHAWVDLGGVDGDRVFTRFAIGDRGRWAVVRRNGHVAKSGPALAWGEGGDSSYVRFQGKDLVAWSDGSARLVELHRGRDLAGQVFAEPGDGVRLVRAGSRLVAQWVTRGAFDEFGAITFGPSMLATGITATELADPGHQLELAAEGAPGDLIAYGDAGQAVVVWGDRTQVHAAWLTAPGTPPGLGEQVTVGPPPGYDTLFGLNGQRVVLTSDGLRICSSLGIDALAGSQTLRVAPMRDVC